MNQYIIDVAKGFVVGNADTYEAEAPVVEKSSRRNEVYPCMAIEGRNFLPTDYGYKSFFGLDNKQAAFGLPAGLAVHELFVHQNVRYINTLVALTDQGIYTKASDAASWALTVSLPAPPADTDYLWTMATIKNIIFMYRQDLGYVIALEEYATNSGAQGTNTGLGLPSTGVPDARSTGIGWVASNYMGFEQITITTLNMAGQIGIFKAGGSLGFWDSADAIAYSAILDVSDFTPSLTSLANISKLSAIVGRITVIKGAGSGFLVYATKSIVRAVAESGSVLRFKGYLVYGNVGVSYPREVVVAQPDTLHFCWTSQGLTQIDISGETAVIVPEVTDFLRQTRLPMYLRFINNRYLVIELLDRSLIEGTVLFSAQTVDPDDIKYNPTQGKIVTIPGTIIKGGEYCTIAQPGSSFPTGGAVNPYSIITQQEAWLWTPDVSSVSYAPLTEGDLPDTYAAQNWPPLFGFPLVGAKYVGTISGNQSNFTQINLPIKEDSFTDAASIQEHYDLQRAAATKAIAYDYETIPDNPVEGDPTEEGSMYKFTAAGRVAQGPDPTTIVVARGQTTGWFEAGKQKLRREHRPSPLFSDESGNSFQSPQWGAIKADRQAFHANAGAADPIGLPSNSRETFDRTTDQGGYRQHHAYRSEESTQIIRTNPDFVNLDTGQVEPTLRRDAVRGKILASHAWAEVDIEYRGLVVPDGILYALTNNAVFYSYVLEGDATNDLGSQPIIHAIIRHTSHGSHNAADHVSHPPTLEVVQSRTYNDNQAITAQDILDFQQNGILKVEREINNELTTAIHNGSGRSSAAEALGSTLFGVFLGTDRTTGTDVGDVSVRDVLVVSVPFRDANTGILKTAQDGIDAILADVDAPVNGDYVGSEYRSYRIESNGTVITDLNIIDSTSYSSQTAGGVQNTSVWQNIVVQTEYDYYLGIQADTQVDYTPGLPSIFPFIDDALTTKDPRNLIGTVHYRHTQGGVAFPFTWLATIEMFANEVVPIPLLGWKGGWVGLRVEETSSVLDAERVNRVITGDEQTTYVDEDGNDLGFQSVEQAVVCGIIEDIVIDDIEVQPVTRTPWIVEIPPLTWLLQNGSPAPLNPTFEAAYFFDTQLRKWGCMVQDYKVLIDYQPLAGQGANGAVQYKNFMIDSGVLTTALTVAIFTDTPHNSYIRYGKYKHWPNTLTSIEEVDVNFREPATGKVIVNTSLDGRQLEYAYSSLIGYQQKRSINLGCSAVGEWHTVTVMGHYDITRIMVTSNRTSRR